MIHHKSIAFIQNKSSWPKLILRKINNFRRRSTFFRLNIMKNHLFDKKKKRFNKNFRYICTFDCHFHILILKFEMIFRQIFWFVPICAKSWNISLDEMTLAVVLHTVSVFLPQSAAIHHIRFTGSVAQHSQAEIKLLPKNCF